MCISKLIFSRCPWTRSSLNVPYANKQCHYSVCCTKEDLVCEFSISAGANCHELGDLKEHKFIISIAVDGNVPVASWIFSHIFNVRISESEIEENVSKEGDSIYGIFKTTWKKISYKCIDFTSKIRLLNKKRIDRLVRKQASFHSVPNKRKSGKKYTEAMSVSVRNSFTFRRTSWLGPWSWYLFTQVRRNRGAEKKKEMSLN